MQGVSRRMSVRPDRSQCSEERLDPLRGGGWEVDK